MSDLIERQAAIDAIYHHNPSMSQNEIRQMLHEVPSAEPEPQWIPVSERLPEVAHSVLLSRRSMDTREGCLQADGKWWQYRWNEILNADQVNAWMPLPEPYREDAVSREAVCSMIIKKYDDCGEGNMVGYHDVLLDGVMRIPSVTPKSQEYKTDHGYMWICPDCGLVVHSDFKKCVRCGHKREE